MKSQIFLSTLVVLMIFLYPQGKLEYRLKFKIYKP